MTKLEATLADLTLAVQASSADPTDADGVIEVHRLRLAEVLAYVVELEANIDGTVVAMILRESENLQVREYPTLAVTA